jgi:hypothetical protein
VILTFCLERLDCPQLREGLILKSLRPEGAFSDFARPWLAEMPHLPLKGPKTKFFLQRKSLWANFALPHSLSRHDALGHFDSPSV